ncbi:hypothetical protein Hdeb2414_s0009g00301561 [Helianthus debilis subsp. tardiflorus]
MLGLGSACKKLERLNLIYKIRPFAATTDPLDVMGAVTKDEMKRQTVKHIVDFIQLTQLISLCLLIHC